MDVLCDYYEARHWINKRVPSSRPDQPKFEACCKQGDVVLPPFRQPPDFLRNLLQDRTPSARHFRQQLRQYNAALSFTSFNCTVTDRGAPGGVNCFQIHGELYHLQGPLDAAASQAPRYAQLYFYDPAYATEARLRANTQLDGAILRGLLDMLYDVNNPYIQLYLTARERLRARQHSAGPSRVILNPQMRLVLEEGADRRRENLPTSDEVAVLIPDEYGDPSYRDIVLADRGGPADQPRCHRINATHAAYMPLHYVLLFPHGDRGWHYQLRLRGARQRDRLTLRQYFRFYLHVRNGHELVPFAYYRLFQQYLVDAWAICDQHQLD